MSSWYECRDCDHSTVENSNKIFCREYHTYVDNGDARRCRKCSINGNLKGSESACYLTTAMCDVLDLPDNNFYLNAMRFLRENFVKKRDGYRHLLEEYDEIGPQISEGIKNNPYKVELATCMRDDYIVPIIEDINMATLLNDGSYYMFAVDKYVNMTNTLKDAFVTESAYTRKRY